ncbi:MAG TPA: methionyl-tRNA formyltransferase [Gemmatimonadales bacterium]|nr:methionyl-tRNA formyltransferase [Gemmatimonadales bacterium]
MRVLFYGTPEFAVPSLTALVGEGFDVVGVVTRPDKPTGRHRSSSRPSPVKEAALAEDLPVFQPDSPAANGFVDQIAALKPDVACVVAYGHILKERVLGVPRLGSINVHASLLPALRGAAPIERAILEGHEETGITIIQMDAGMDTGPILHQVSTPIAPEETAGELRIRLAEMGALALVEALTLLDGTGITPRRQDESAATWAPKLAREEERLDLSRPALEVSRRIRAFDPAPGAWCQLRGRPLKLFGARLAEGAGEPGTVLALGDTMVIACGAGAVAVSEVQPAGRNRMRVRDFANGRLVREGEVLT